MCFFAEGQSDVLLQHKIDSLYTIDQQVQSDMILAYQRNEGQKVIESLDKIKDATFKRQVIVLKEIIHQYGLPTYRLVGKAASDNFLTMVNHGFSDIPFQEQIAKLAQPEVSRDNISGPALAMMIDKMRINSDRQQLYGSQLTYDSAGHAMPVNLYKPRKVDKRRKKMKMNPIAEYLQMATELHQQMNKVK
jgi:hypothetical protein